MCGWGACGGVARHAVSEFATVFSGTFLFSNNSWLIVQNAPLPTEGVSVHHCSGKIGLDLLSEIF